MANDACDKATAGASSEQPSRLCSDALRMAYSPTASMKESVGVPQAERDKADVLILKTPALALAAADHGQYSATIMRLGSAGYDDTNAPQLSGASKLVFDRLQSSGFNPSVEKVSRDSASGYDWAIKANWKPEQKADPDLQLRTAAALKRQSADDAAAKVKSFEAGMRAADATVLQAPGLAREAADAGADSLAIAKVESIYSRDGHGKQPELDAAQQKIFDGLKAKGLNPSVEPGDWKSSSYGSSERAWVIKANWKDGQNPDNDLNRAMHSAQDRKAAAAQAEAAKNVIQRQEQVAETIAMIPSLFKQAEIDNKDAFGVLKLGSYHHSHGSGFDKPPKLDEYQQRVFDELARLSLSPSIEKSHDVAPPESSSHSSGPSWVLAAHRPKPSGTP
jgi:hypothetical protein